MPYIVLKNGKARPEKASSFLSILSRYNDMYKYAIYISGKLVYVVVKEHQPHDWERGWAE